MTKQYVLSPLDVAAVKAYADKLGWKLCSTETRGYKYKIVCVSGECTEIDSNEPASNEYKNLSDVVIDLLKIHAEDDGRGDVGFCGGKVIRKNYAKRGIMGPEHFGQVHREWIDRQLEDHKAGHYVGFTVSSSVTVHVIGSRKVIAVNLFNYPLDDRSVTNVSDIIF